MDTKKAQDNLYMLLPLSFGWSASWFSADKGISLTDTVNLIYRSKNLQGIIHRQHPYRLLEQFKEFFLKAGLARGIFFMEGGVEEMDCILEGRSNEFTGQPENLLSKGAADGAGSFRDIGGCRVEWGIRFWGMLSVGIPL